MKNLKNLNNVNKPLIQNIYKYNFSSKEIYKMKKILIILYFLIILKMKFIFVHMLVMFHNMQSLKYALLIQYHSSLKILKS